MESSLPKRRRVKKRRLRWWIPLFLIAAVLWIVFGFREHIRRQVVVLTEQPSLEWALPAQAAVLLKEECLAVPEKELQPDRQLVGQRVGVHTKIGEGTLPDGEKKVVPGNVEATVESAVRKDRFSALAWLPLSLQASREHRADPTLEYAEALKTDNAIAVQKDGAIYANRAGVFKSPLDGWESLLRYEALESIDVDTASAWMRGAAANTTATAPGISVIDNSAFGLAVLTDGVVDATQTPTFRIPGFTFSAEHVRVVPGKSKTLFLFDLREGFEALEGRRFLQGELVEEAWKGVQFPAKALWEKDGAVGVFRKNDDAIVEFVPLPVYRESKGTVYAKPTDDGLQLYDEIFLNPAHVKEGDFIE